MDEECICEPIITDMNTHKFGITKIQIVGDEMVIHTFRPGLLIGVRGGTFNKLKARCDIKYRIVEAIMCPVEGLFKE